MVCTEATSSSSNWRASAGSGSQRLLGKRAVVVVFSHYPSDPRPRREAEALMQLGMRVEVLCLKQDESEPRREIYNGVGIFRIPLKRRRGGRFSYVFQYSAFLLISFGVLSFRSLTRRYHLVHVHNMRHSGLRCAGSEDFRRKSYSGPS